MIMNRNAPPPILLGRSLIDMLRSIPGYDFLSTAGGSALSLITAGSFSPEVQSNLMKYLDFVTEVSGKPRSALTPADLEKYADLYQSKGNSFATPMLIGVGGVAVIALILALSKKK